MPTRKIQLIAGTTYSVSLPKQWVLKNSLKEQDEIELLERDDRTLLINAHASNKKELDEISLNIDEYVDNIEEIILGLYNLGVENINLFSKTEITKPIKALIRKAITQMSGTEIAYEDKQKIHIRVLLDKNRIDVLQAMYRSSLIIEAMAENISGELNIDELKINENEIDRLYQLVSKIITLSLVDSAILKSSGIEHSTFIPSYFLIAKRLENIGDCFYALAKYVEKTGSKLDVKEDALSFLTDEIIRGTKYLLGKQKELFKKSEQNEVADIGKKIKLVKDNHAQNLLEQIIRLIIDIQEEIINISFYGQLIRQKVI